MPEVTETQDSSQNSFYSPLDDPLFLSPNDQPNLQLTAYLFDGNNFHQWQRDVIQALVSKNKVGFITGDCSVPDPSDKKFNQWVRCDLLVLRWILNSVSKTLRDNLQYADSSKALWIEIVERFGQLNILELYDLKKTLSNLVQENLSLLEYYSKIRSLWEGIDNMDPMPTCKCGVMSKCTCNIMKRLLDRETQAKLIQLLMGLNSGYEQVQTTLLSMEPLPPINRALGMLQKIEKQKLINDSTSESLVEGAAYNVKKRISDTAPTDESQQKRFKDASTEFCTHCERKGHDIADCFKLKTCTFCNIKGHIQERCYKFKAFNARKNKGKGKGTGFSRSANNAYTTCSDQDDEYVDVTPIDDHSAIVSHNSGKATTDQVYPDMVQSIVDSVTAKVLKAISDKSAPEITPLQSSVHFAGPFK
ncbi:uncharacterized protein LOC141632196 [Silene latifolia]|uniref:uncharacterized protein LOC141632196 n=1 Tax=Silene latifolia TaxID=37657 RepID=UPI003D782560